MPVLAGIPWLIPLLTAVGTAGSLATTGYELANAGGGGGNQQSQQQQLQQQQQQQLQQQQAQQKAAFLAAQPSVQASTGGSLVGNALSTQTASTAGVPSDLNSIAQYLAGSGGGGKDANISGGTTTPNSGTPGGDGTDLAGLAKNFLAAA